MKENAQSGSAWCGAAMAVAIIPMLSHGSAVSASVVDAGGFANWANPGAVFNYDDAGAGGVRRQKKKLGIERIDRALSRLEY